MTDKAQVIAEVVDLWRRTSRSLRQQSPEAWLGLSLTIAQLKSLFFISNAGSTTPRQLAAALSVTPSNVTGIVDRLVEQELVGRQEDPNDRRSLQLRVTDKGESILAALRERRTTYLSASLSHLSIEDLSIVSKGLNLLRKAAEEHEKGQS
ncbi:MAG: MarR family transcriptional regulator [Dehalococcoidia bacterium]|nr:MarR family transcriptional regulator [Dehalococcoidia bacterium]